MRLTKKEFVKYVNNFEKMIQEESTLIRALDISPEWKPGNWIYEYYNLIIDMCLNDSDPENEESWVVDYLGYFCYELEFGKKADDHPITETLEDGTKKKHFLRNAEDLYDFIVEN